MKRGKKFEKKCRVENKCRGAYVILKNNKKSKTKTINKKML
jgi:hypothetical protein